jgi:hypothetical protein
MLYPDLTPSTVPVSSSHTQPKKCLPSKGNINSPVLSDEWNEYCELGDGYSSVLEEVHRYVCRSFNFDSSVDEDGNVRPITHVLYNAGTDKYDMFLCPEMQIDSGIPGVICSHCEARRRNHPPAFIADPVVCSLDDLLSVLLSSRGILGTFPNATKLPSCMTGFQEAVALFYENRFSSGKGKVKSLNNDIVTKPSVVENTEKKKKMMSSEMVVNKKKKKGKKEDVQKRMYDPNSFPKLPSDVFKSVSHLSLFRSFHSYTFSSQDLSNPYTSTKKPFSVSAGVSRFPRSSPPVSPILMPSPSSILRKPSFSPVAAVVSPRHVAHRTHHHHHHHHRPVEQGTLQISLPPSPTPSISETPPIPENNTNVVSPSVTRSLISMALLFYTASIFCHPVVRHVNSPLLVASLSAVPMVMVNKQVSQSVSFLLSQLRILESRKDEAISVDVNSSPMDSKTTRSNGIVTLSPTNIYSILPFVSPPLFLLISNLLQLETLSNTCSSSILLDLSQRPKEEQKNIKNERKSKKDSGSSGLLIPSKTHQKQLSTNDDSKKNIKKKDLDFERNVRKGDSNIDKSEKMFQSKNEGRDLDSDGSAKTVRLNQIKVETTKNNLFGESTGSSVPPTSSLDQLDDSQVMGDNVKLKEMGVVKKKVWETCIEFLFLLFFFFFFFCYLI